MTGNKKAGMRFELTWNLSYPELDQEESIVWPFVKKLLQASLLLRELVVDLPNVHRLQTGVAVAGVGLADVYEQVLVKLEKQKCLSGGEPSQKQRKRQLSLYWLECSALFEVPAQLSHYVLDIPLNHI